ncbi:MAG TPA: Rpn family recombination-promoting nuclease/putative transposase [Bacillota bacterium]|nr:Rpn family recombination-promoting nuclease/putative transposase [Bacillota bacterium]
MMAEQPQFPHDKGYKNLLSYKEIFLELLESFVDQGWVTELDHKQISRINKRFVYPEFIEKEADIIYQLKINGHEVIFYLLLELQSKVDFEMPYRLLQYMIGVWNDRIKNVGRDVTKLKAFKLPVIVPIVLYNGEGSWTACRSFKETLEGAERFGEYVVDYRYILINVNQYTKERLLQTSNLISTVFLLEQAIDEAEYIRRFQTLGEIVPKFDGQRYRLFWTWFEDISSWALPEELRQELLEIKQKAKTGEEKMMISNMGRNLQRYYDEAILKGKKEEKLDLARNFLRMNIDMNIIAAGTGLTIKEIERLKVELEQQ